MGVARATAPSPRVPNPANRPSIQPGSRYGVVIQEKPRTRRRLSHAAITSRGKPRVLAHVYPLHTSEPAARTWAVLSDGRYLQPRFPRAAQDEAAARHRGIG